ncbi:MAG: xanthine dehydrogenase family protein molybdopterin-binding subunit, partial [Alphaproteobacteria bacterium]|nr:xanthine dehydrogenase family protein molybdopterin-binding subunit [Alphaproteobacteria bacterium]
MTENGIGARVARKEDRRFLTGAGNYTDDINRFGQTYAYFLRSPHAHARINRVDTAAARASPGVLAVLTGADIADAGLGGLICGWMIHSKDGTPMNAPPHAALAADKVRYVGDHVAMVVAETYAQARDAAEAVAVDYEELRAVIALTEAENADAAQIHDSVPGNLCYDWELGDKAATDGAFAAAAHVTSLDLVQNRLIPNAIEPRAAIGEYDRASDSFTLTTTSQNPHVTRLVMSAFVQIAPENKLRVVAPDVGGGFGSKIYIYAEETVALWASKQVGRPVKWCAERAESFLADAHARDHATHAELALDKDGKFLGLRVTTKANMGAYLSTFASAIPTYLYGTLLAGQYTTPAIYCDVQAVFTNTAPVDAYRGAGRPEAAYVIERLVDAAAREMDIDPAELRRRNMIAAGDFPHRTVTGHTYDSGDYARTLDAGLAGADRAGFEARREAAAARGRLRGFGMAYYVERCGVGGSETARIRFDATGALTLLVGTQSNGQGHETAYAQIASALLSVPLESIRVVQGDTDAIGYGRGTGGSRSLQICGPAIQIAAAKVVAKARRIAGHMLEAAEADITFTDGRFTVRGTDRAVTLG